MNNLARQYRIIYVDPKCKLLRLIGGPTPSATLITYCLIARAGGWQIASIKEVVDGVERDLTIDQLYQFALDALEYAYDRLRQHNAILETIKLAMRDQDERPEEINPPYKI